MPQHRISAFGYGPASAGENAAAGYSTAEQVFAAWKGSSGHNTNMLRSMWKSIGIGRACKQGTRYGCYWVTDFGSIVAAPNPNLPYPDVLFTPTPTPNPTATPSPSPAPTPTPSPLGLAWGGISCEGPIVPQDAVSLLANDAGVSFSAAAGGNCPAVGQAVFAGGEYRLWGDIDCSGQINAVDSVKLLLWLIGVTVESNDPDCPAAGSPV
jgi:hypothetical protein